MSRLHHLSLTSIIFQFLPDFTGNLYYRYDIVVHDVLRTNNILSLGGIEHIELPPSSQLPPSQLCEVHAFFMSTFDGLSREELMQKARFQ